LGQISQGSMANFSLNSIGITQQHTTIKFPTLGVSLVINEHSDYYYK
jgi:hypothetical protein